jgi:hypothetical protein
MEQGMKTRYKYIHWTDQGELLQGVAQMWRCQNNRTGNCLGFAVYNAAWKKWMFSPAEFTEFSIDCLRDIAHFMEQLPKD